MSAVRLSPAVIENRPPLDQLIAGSAAFLLVLGVVMVGSASTEISARNFGHPFYLLVKHSAFIALALVGLLATLVIPIRTWQRLHVIAYLGALLLLICVPVSYTHPPSPRDRTRSRMPSSA